MMTEALPGHTPFLEALLVRASLSDAWYVIARPDSLLRAGAAAVVGRLTLATCACVQDDKTCELKRLFSRPEYR